MSAPELIVNEKLAGSADKFFSVAGDCVGARAPNYVNAKGETQRCPEYCLASKDGGIVVITVDRSPRSQCGRPGVTCRTTGAPCLIAPGLN